MKNDIYEAQREYENIIRMEAYEARQDERYDNPRD
jgi:hypothetical protein